MARQAETSGGGGLPFVKFQQLGDTLKGAFAGGKTRQQTSFQTKEPMFKADGKPLQEEVLYFVAMPGCTAHVGDSDNPSPIADMDHVRYPVGGFKWGQVIDQRRSLPEYAGFKAGTACSGDIYNITLVGWSVETENADGARKAGFTVVDGRIVIRDQADKDKYVLARSAKNQPTILGNDFDITIRRPTAAEKAWEQAADALFDAKPWEGATATAAGAGAPANTSNAADYEDF